MNKSIRNRVWRRAGDCCEYCRIPQALDELPFQIDHVRAAKHGGGSSAANLALACFYCNSYKGPNVAGYDPVTDVLTRLYDPRTDRWHEHFQRNGASIEGPTDIGRTTVDALRINEPSRVEHRRLLIALGELTEKA